MSLQTKLKLKIDFANTSERGLNRPENNDSFGKFPHDHSDLSTAKGQLFVVADAKSRNPHGRDAGKMAIRIIQENYFSYPSDDPSFSMQRAFDTANRQIYQYAQANGLHRKIGATCSAIVLTDRHAYLGHVGDCRIYRVSVRKIDQLTHDHTRVIEMMPREGENGAARQAPSRPVLTRALGIRLGVKIDTINRIPVHRDEYFVLCTDGMKYVDPEDIRNIVLSSSPQSACRRLIELARRNGATDDTTVQIIKVYNDFAQPQIETYSHINEFSNGVNNAPLYFVLIFLLAIFGFLIRESVLQNLSGFWNSTMAQYELLKPSEKGASSYIAEEKRRISSAQGHLSLGRIDDALKIYRSILLVDPEHPEALDGIVQVSQAYKLLADRAAAQNNWPKAAKQYRLAFKLNPVDLSLDELAKKAESALIKSRKVKRTRRKTAVRTFAKLNTRNTAKYLNKPIIGARINGIKRSQWAVAGLKENQDFNVARSSIRFFNNYLIKKAFHNEMYDSMEVEVQTRLYSGKEKSRYGIIFGHRVSNTDSRKKTFYLFTVDSNGRYFLEKVAPRRVKPIMNGRIAPNKENDFKANHLRIKCIGNLILLYANGEVVKMHQLSEKVQGGVGLYVDPKVEVEFSQFSVKPAKLR